MAFERILAKKIPKTEPVPRDVQCYICLDGGDVLRGCACRGPSAGFAHVDCLAEMAARDQWITIVGRDRLNRWTSCATCCEAFNGALRIELTRRWWRHARDAPDSDAQRQALLKTVHVLILVDEGDAAAGLADEATHGLARDDLGVLTVEIGRASVVNRTNPAAALEILTALQARIGRCESAYVRSAFAYGMALVLRCLGRSREARPFAAESVELARSVDGPESSTALTSGRLHALVLADVGRVQEARAELSAVLAAQTRVLGADHPNSRDTKAALDRVSAMSA